MQTKPILSIEGAETNLAKLETQKGIFTQELDAIIPQIEAAKDKMIEAVISGDSKAVSLRQGLNELQARKIELELALRKIQALIVDSQLDLKDARQAAYQARIVELAKDINKVGKDAVKALKVVVGLFDQHEVLFEEMTTLTLSMQQAGVPSVERDSIIQFRRANEYLDQVLNEIAAGTFKMFDGKTILDEYDIPTRVNRINARREAVGQIKRDYLNGKVGG